MEIKKHPFGNFLPAPTRFLIVGTFPGRQYTLRSDAENEADPLAFSYGGRNQFWRILELVYDTKLVTRADKQGLLARYHIGLSDLIASCSRKKASNLDSALENITWNKETLQHILDSQPIETVFCTGKAVAAIFQSWFPDVPCVALPSPSPAFASMRFADKVAFYEKVLPVK
jgi:hypoxanthine-DNA glycosylase